MFFECSLFCKCLATKWTYIFFPSCTSEICAFKDASCVKELEHIDYSCINKGKTWSLMGEYQPGVDYIFDHNVAIIDGNLRIYCATKGVLGQV